MPPFSNLFVFTRIPKRQHIIFWADNKPTRGTFHTNFTLAPDRANWIGIYDADGRTMNIKAGTSYIALVTSVTGQELTVTNSSGEEILG